MCGLAGRFHPLELPPAPGWREKAGALLAHRGPDGEGAYSDERVELVHRRLALVDLSPTGGQPMLNEDGSVVVVYNGEIYNHRELRRDLVKRGHQFRGTSDTEVLVHLYEDVGDDMASELRGIFAFALYDRRRNRLLLVRDRFGVKPLYYANLGDQWVFASEMKAITALHGFDPGIDRQACYDYLGLGFVPEPATGFKRIHALEPGCTMAVGTSGLSRARYHEIAANPDTTLTLSRVSEMASQFLMDAVEKQSFADVPVAALLSGGIDSSLVVAAHCRTLGNNTRTLNVRFPDVRHDETAAARAVAKHYGTEHMTVDGSRQSLDPETMIDLLSHFDQPFADTSCFPMYWVSKAIRDSGTICALSGDGGDEAFGGYSRFWTASKLHKLAQAPGWVLALTRATGSVVAGYTRDFGRQAARAAVLAEAVRDDVPGMLAGLSNYLSESQKQELVYAAAREQLEPCARLFQDDVTSYDSGGLEDISRRMTESMFALTLPGDMLRKVDMMSMRASIEVRVPMLDEDLVSLGLTLPHRLKTDGRKGKLVLRELARRFLPDSVARQPKHGFEIPMDVMVPPEVHVALRDLLCAPDSRTRQFMNESLVQSWLTSFAGAGNGKSGGAISRGGLYQRVTSLMSLEVWMRNHDLVW